MPAFLAVATQALASKSMGLNTRCSVLYSFTRIFRLFITHSPLPNTLEAPQWMNIPNFMSWKFFLAARLAAEGR